MATTFVFDEAAPATANGPAPALAEANDAGRQRLWHLLNEWMTLDETRATWEEVEALYRAIVGVWRTRPDAAEAWYAAWRAARSASRP